MMKLRRKGVVILLGLCSLAAIGLVIRQIGRGPRKLRNISRSSIQQVPEKPKLILFYTRLWNTRKWPGLETTEKFNNWHGKTAKGLAIFLRDVGM